MIEDPVQQEDLVPQPEFHQEVSPEDQAEIVLSEIEKKTKVTACESIAKSEPRKFE